MKTVKGIAAAAKEAYARAKAESTADLEFAERMAEKLGAEAGKSFSGMAEQIRARIVELEAEGEAAAAIEAEEIAKEPGPGGELEPIKLSQRAQLALTRPEAVDAKRAAMVASFGADETQWPKAAQPESEEPIEDLP